MAVRPWMGVRHTFCSREQCYYASLPKYKSMVSSASKEYDETGSPLLGLDKVMPMFA